MFVGKDVQFDWGYRDDGGKKVNDLFFGWVNGSDDINIVKKGLPEETLLWNGNVPASVRNRIQVKESDTGGKSSMKIKKVQMNDAGIYFCKLSWDPIESQPTSSVSLKVVGKCTNF